jgi:hypothetical protein
MNFLKKFCLLLEKTEVPPRFAIWCGLSTLLSVMERRIWIAQGVFNIYPNFFIILVAASGQKKSTPINLVDKLLRRIEPKGPNIVAQKVSPEALISAIKSQETQDSKHLLQQSCGGIVIADELATFLDRGALDRGLGPILTKLFDCSNFEYETLKRGTETVEGGYLSILGGTTIELLRSCLPRDAIGGGFTSRTIFVYEDKVAPPVPWVEYDETMIDVEVELVQYLTRIFDLRGPITVAPDARAFFEHDYRERYHHTEFRRNANLQGYENRRHTHLFKIAIALMLAEDPSLSLQLHHIRGAKYILEEAEEQMPRVMDLIVASDVGSQGNRVFQYIQSLGQVSRSDLVRHFGHQMDTQEISKALDVLVVGRRVKLETRGSKLIYSIEKGV